MPGTKISQRMRALQLARDCATLGARIRTIHHLTGLRPRELLHLLFNSHAMPPGGRAPNSREWYHHANLVQRIEASIVIANFRRMRQLGFLARTEAEWQGATVQRLTVSYPRGGVPGGRRQGRKQARGWGVVWTWQLLRRGL